MADKSAEKASVSDEGESEVAAAQCHLAKMYRALGHPARLAIIEALASRKGACCGEIVDWLPLAQSTVSQHLQVLKETGLLACETKGRTCHYCLNTDMLTEAATASDRFFARVSEPGQTCMGMSIATDEQIGGIQCPSLKETAGE
jgi:ArsR family transcriptional regulator